MAHRDWSRSPITGKEVDPSYIHASDFYFRDTSGRAILLRGICFSGSSKSALDRPTQRTDGFWEDAEAGGSSFVGQPLDLDDGSADVHLARLRAWGFNCIRYLFTWEALEHSGPRQYDYQYMDYVVAVLRKIKQYGFKVYMDPHQDLFSRFTGGSGAPYWVLIACGLNPRNLTATQAAFLHSEWPSPEAPDPVRFPDMLWATNYTRLAAATLSVFFFGGRQFAPLCVIDGQNIQDWLQDHCLAAIEELAKRIAEAGDLVDDCVIGWDSINEPNRTYISLPDLSVLPEEWKLRKEGMPSPIQSFRLGVGQKQTVEHYVFGSLGAKRSGNVTVDPQGKSVWLTHEQDQVQGGSKWGWKRSPDWPLGKCVWAAHGVWDQDSGELLRPDYFYLYRSAAGAMPANFTDDYWLPHWREYARRIRRIHPEAIMFLQPPVFEPPPPSLTPDDLKQRACVSAHFYDGLTLITKHWNWFNADAVGIIRGKYASVLLAVRIGSRAIRECMRKQLGYLRADTTGELGSYPTLIGEIGIPFDLDGKRSYYGDAHGRGRHDYSAQTLALDASLNACDGDNVLNYTMWTYCPDNTHKWGDGWNGEDLSIWSADDVEQPEQGGEGTSGSPSPRSARSRTVSLSVSSATMVGSLVLPSTKGGDDTDKPQQPHPWTNPLAPADIGALSNGARSIAAFCRPYPMATSGTPLSIQFDLQSSEFVYTFEASATLARRDEAGEATTEIYLPYVHYAEEQPDATHEWDRVGRQNSLGVQVDVSAGRWETRGQVLYWFVERSALEPGKRFRIKVRRSGGAFASMMQTKRTGAGCCIL